MKEKQKGGQGGILLLQNSVEAINTQKEFARIAKVSHDTIAKIKAIEEKDFIK